MAILETICYDSTPDVSILYIFVCQRIITFSHISNDIYLLSELGWKLYLSKIFLKCRAIGMLF